ncbi:MAG TPA: R3H domain-containing nucleic acid-binding protein [Candidatus Paceibacterota bacterium]
MHITEAKIIVEHFLKMLTIDATRVEISANDPHPLLNINTTDSGILIGSEGENLRALNYIVRKIIEKKTTGGGEASSTPPFLIDVNGYHRKHIASIRQQSYILSERARTFRSDVVMDPMNSYDRMIVHALFSHDPEIQTESVGVGKQRHIVFKYKKPQEMTFSSDRTLFAK